MIFIQARFYLGDDLVGFPISYAMENPDPHPGALMRMATGWGKRQAGVRFDRIEIEVPGRGLQLVHFSQVQTGGGDSQ